MSDKTKQNDPRIESELHLMASELIASVGNQTAQSVRQRMAAASGGYDFADTLHNIYMDYGYPCELQFFNYWNMYKRFGIAKNVVELPVKTGWITPPTIEAPEAFIKELDTLNRRINLWTRFRGLDNRQRIGRYAGMFMRVRDDKEPKEPLEGTFQANALVEMMPLYESQLRVSQTDTEPKSDTFGQPILIEYSQGAIGSKNEQVNSSITIHASRIVFVSEGSDNNWIYGESVLEPVYNSLMDLRKIIGGGAEGFYKNAAQNAFFNLKNPEKVSGFQSKLDSFSEQYTEFNQDRFKKALWGPGMDMKMMQTTLVNPKDFFMNALNDVAAGADPVIPATILIGQQTGRLASNEDSRHFLSGVQSRREDFQTVLTRANLDWLIKFGFLPKNDYEVIWDDLLARSDTEKLDSSGKMSEINERQFKSGAEVPFSGDEIREAAGFDKVDLEEPGSEELELDENDEPIE